MEIQTHTPENEDSRRTTLQLHARDYPVADADNEFTRYLRDYSLRYESTDPSIHASAPARVYRHDAAHPYIQVSMDKCVTCFRCVRICNEVQGQFVWDIWDRGNRTEIRPRDGYSMLGSGCVSCGACVDTCPSGALEDKSVLLEGAPNHWTTSTCPYCGTGCEMLVGTREDRIVQIKPILDAPVNRGHLCVKGRYAFQFVDAPDRCTQPMIREVGRGVPTAPWGSVSWKEAIDLIAQKFSYYLDEFGPESIGVLGSARATNEENYLTQKFARVVLDTNNIDCCARVCHGPTAAAMKSMLGTGAATNSFDDIEAAKAIMICGCNPTENHPIVGARIKQAVLKGARLIVIDPRRIELADYANLHLQLSPGTNIPLLNALAHVIVQERLFDPGAIADRVAEWDGFQQFIAAWTPERAAGICGVDSALIREAARLYAQTKPAICFHGLGMTEHVQGTEGVMALVNLALLTGNFGQPGTGINPLRGQNNVQGSAHMGCEPGNLTGYVALDQGRELFERVWKSPAPASRGLDLMQMMDAATAGRLKVLWAIGYDILLTNPNASATRRALDNIEFIVVQDIFLNEIARAAGSVFLPACSAYEKDGTFMNSDRRVQRVRKAIETRGDSKPDWQIICDVAHAMGFSEQFNFSSPKDIWEEVRAVWQAGAGITYDRLEHGGVQWPCPSEDHPGTSILHAESFAHGKRAPLARIDYSPPIHPPVHPSTYPFLLTTGRNLYQFNAGTMTRRTPNAQLWPADYLEISPPDAASLNVADGDTVRLISPYGQTTIPVKIMTRIKPGQLFATFNTTDHFINRLTSPGRDTAVNTPEYKVTPVRVEKVLATTGGPSA
jgi:formate dehydrogenase major subunit